MYEQTGKTEQKRILSIWSWKYDKLIKTNKQKTKTMAEMWSCFIFELNFTEYKIIVHIINEKY